MNNEPNQHDTIATESSDAPAEAGDHGAGQQQSSAEQATGADARPEPPQASYTDPRDLRIQMLERVLAERESTLHSYIRAHKKAEADFDAFRQRLNRDKDKEVEAAAGKLVEKLLDVDENFERTVSAGTALQATSPAVEGLVAGMRMVHKMFLERLGELGLQRVDPTGLPFDPNSMEALGVVAVNDPREDGRVAITLRAGFKLGDRELRPALVQIGKLFT